MILVAIGKLFLHIFVKTHHVHPDAARRLLGDLERSLKQGNREILDGHCGHENSEVRVHLLFLEKFFHDAFDLRQNRNREVAVLQEDPVAFFGRLFKEVLSFTALAFAKRNLDDLLITLALCNRLQSCGWVGAWAQDEDDWCIIFAFFDNLLDASRTGCDKLFVVHSLLNEIATGEVYTIWTETSQDDHLFDRILALGDPLTGQLSIFRLW